MEEGFEETAAKQAIAIRSRDDLKCPVNGYDVENGIVSEQNHVSIRQEVKDAAEVR